MDSNETMVEQDLDVAADDTLSEEIVEEVQDESESLASLMNEGAGEEPAEEPQEQATQATEPGWIKKRVEKAVNKAIEQTRAEMQAMFEQQMAPIRAKMMEDEAQALVASRKVADIETAREFVRLKNGMPAAAPAVSAQEPKREQPRQSNGQYAAKPNTDNSVRVSMLEHQADAIKAETGLDVTVEFMNNPDINAKVKSGEMDFYDVARYMQQKKKRPPSPTRSPNGASGMNPNSIMNMTDEQFERLEEKIKRGARIRLE